MNRKLLLACLGAVALVAPMQAHAWGSTTHRLIARLAYERLTPAARAEVDRLVSISRQQATPQCPVKTFEDAALWPDCVREAGLPAYKPLTRYHTERIRLCRPPNRAEYCPDGRCGSAETERAITILRDRSAAPAKRLQALEEVAHFLPDLHQPLHSVQYRGKRGQNIDVRLPGRAEPLTLHHAWDKQLTDRAVGDAAGIAAVRSMVAQGAGSMTSGGPAAWALQSHELGVRHGYEPLFGASLCRGGPGKGVHPVSTAYVEQALPVIRRQVALSAVRLSYVLNQSLG
ncbi:MAG TPA: S1/P1 nuclease [Caulobacteraceae bacterium]|jgi:hypothetical protein